MVSHEETERESEQAIGAGHDTTYQAWDVVHNERHFRISQALGLLAFLLPFNSKGVSDHNVSQRLPTPSAAPCTQQ